MQGAVSLYSIEYLVNSTEVMSTHVNHTNAASLLKVTYLATLQPPDPGPNGRFGYAIDFQQGVLIVGSSPVSRPGPYTVSGFFCH